jgi:hypothetical protein
LLLLEALDDRECPDGLDRGRNLLPRDPARDDALLRGRL